MGIKRIGFATLALAVLVIACGGKPQINREQKRLSALTSPVNDKTVVRFFYDPAGDYFHAPLLFRGVKEDDSLLNTAPMREEGRTAYVSLDEMRALVQALVRLDVPWQESEIVEVLGSYKKLSISDDMEILIGTSTGTARTKISPTILCKTLEPVDVALKSPRALWEFQALRLNDGCKVAGFKYGAYPDH